MTITWSTLAVWAARGSVPHGWTLEYEFSPLISFYPDSEALRRTFRERSPSSCWWQRFTLTDINGQQLILQLNHDSTMQQFRREKKEISVLVPA